MLTEATDRPVASRLFTNCDRNYEFMINILKKILQVLILLRTSGRFVHVYEKETINYKVQLQPCTKIVTGACILLSSGRNSRC